MNKLLVAAIVSTLVVGQAVAGSGQKVVKIEIDSTTPDCLIYKTNNDNTRYGTSVNDPLYDQTVITLNSSRNVGWIVTFLTGDPGGLYHAEDCPAPIVYTYNIGY